MAEHVTCREVVELVTDYVEGSLSPDETTLFEQHLNFCQGCDTYVGQMRATVDALGRVGAEEEVPPVIKAKLLNAFRDWKRS